VLLNETIIRSGGVDVSCAALTAGIGGLDLTVGSAAESSRVDARQLPFGLTVEVFGTAVVHGSEHVDMITIGAGRAYGYGGNDRLDRGSPPPGTEASLFGGGGADVVGCSELSTCDGGRGDDTIYATGPGAVTGGDGNDVFLVSGRGPTTIDGGAGSDVVEISPAAADVSGAPETLSVTPGADPGSVVIAGDRNPTASLQIEKVRIAAPYGSTTVTMSASVGYSLTAASGQPTSVTVRVPGGVWTRKPAEIVAPGLRRVTLSAGLGSSLTVVAA
jgi:hypothetical protein